MTYGLCLTGFVPLHPLKDEGPSISHFAPKDNKENNNMGIIETAISKHEESIERIENAMKSLSNAVTTICCYLDGAQGISLIPILDEQKKLLLTIQEMHETTSAQVRILQAIRNSSETTERLLNEIRTQNEQFRKDSKPTKNRPAAKRTRKDSAKKPSKPLRRRK